jgi:hypothetical protein
MFEGRCEEVRMEEWGDERELGGFKGVECKWGKKRWAFGKTRKEVISYCPCLSMQSNFSQKVGGLLHEMFMILR